ncbi:MAG: hypothetical protein H0T92_02085, partial [Pyrinomonadaceae bacterium]|nr:hypothetical protein [Pyrinomonadaceae bacterium]
MSEAENKQRRRRWLNIKCIMVMTVVFGVQMVGAQTPAQTPAPPRPGTLEGRQGGATGAGEAAPSALQTTQLSSSQFLDPSGFTVERLAETGFSRRADLLAARQRLAIAEGRLL